MLADVLFASFDLGRLEVEGEAAALGKGLFEEAAFLAEVPEFGFQGVEDTADIVFGLEGLGR